MKNIFALGVVLLLIFSIQTAHASTYPDGCTATTAYSSTTGHPCTETLPDCNPGDLYSAATGRPCTQQTYLPGCTSTIGYSSTTGTKCDGSTNPNVTRVTPDTLLQQQLNQVTQELSQIAQNTAPATPTPVTPTPTPIVTLSNLYVRRSIYWRKNNNETEFSFLLTSTSTIVGLTVTPEIDGTPVDTGNYSIPLTAQVIGNYSSGNSDRWANLQFTVDDLSDGTHTATVTIGDQTKSITFTIAPNPTN